MDMLQALNLQLITDLECMLIVLQLLAIVHTCYSQCMSQHLFALQCFNSMLGIAEHALSCAANLIEVGDWKDPQSPSSSMAHMLLLSTSTSCGGYTDVP